MTTVYVIKTLCDVGVTPGGPEERSMKTKQRIRMYFHYEVSGCICVVGAYTTTLDRDFYSLILCVSPLCVGYTCCANLTIVLPAPIVDLPSVVLCGVRAHTHVTRVAHGKSSPRCVCGCVCARV